MIREVAFGRNSLIREELLYCELIYISLILLFVDRRTDNVMFVDTFTINVLIITSHVKRIPLCKITSPVFSFLVDTFTSGLDNSTHQITSKRQSYSYVAFNDRNKE